MKESYGLSPFLHLSTFTLLCRKEEKKGIAYLHITAHVLCNTMCDFILSPSIPTQVDPEVFNFRGQNVEDKKGGTWWRQKIAAGKDRILAVPGAGLWVDEIVYTTEDRIGLYSNGLTI